MILKKEFMICILILLIIIFLDVVLNNHFEQEKNEFDNIIEEIQISIINNENCINKINNLSDKWKEFGNIAAFYTEHNELEKVSLKISILKKNIEIDDKNMAIEYLEEVKFWLNHIMEKDKLKLKNIF